MHTSSEFTLSGTIKEFVKNGSGGALMILEVSGKEVEILEKKTDIPTFATPMIRIVITKRLISKLKNASYLAKDSSVYIRGRVYGRKTLVQNRPFYYCEARAEMIRPGRVKDNSFNVGGRIVAADVRNSGAIMLFVKSSQNKESEIGRGDGAPMFYTPTMPIKINNSLISAINFEGKRKTSDNHLHPWQNNYLSNGENISEHFYITSRQEAILKAFGGNNNPCPTEYIRPMELFLKKRTKTIPDLQMAFLDYFYLNAESDVFIRGYITSTRRDMQGAKYYQVELQGNDIQKVIY